MTVVAVNLEVDRIFDDGEVELDDSAVSEAKQVSARHCRQSGAGEKSTHLPLEHGTRQAVDALAAGANVRHRADPIATRRAQHRIALFDLRASPSLATLSRVVRLFDAVRFGTRSKREQRARE